MRRQHRLKRNKGNEQPQDAIWVDTETEPDNTASEEQRHELMFGWACHRRTVRPGEWTQPIWFKFESIDEFWDWVESRLHGRTRLYIFAHNWAFDAPVLDTFNQLPERRFRLTAAVIQSPPVILKWRRDPHTIQMVDTLNIWRMPLAKLGKSIGLEKGVMPDYNAPQTEWDAYGKRDTEIIMVACMKWWQFLQDNDLGGFAATLAAQALRTYRHRFMRHEILIDDDKEALTLARDALHGGRTEAFYIGDCPETIYKLDINSQYPRVMQSEMMPSKLIGYYKNVTFTELMTWLTKYCVVAKVLINTNEPAYGTVHDKRLIFPTGRFVTALCTPELYNAMIGDHVEKIFSVAVYEPAQLFKHYIDWMYTHRLKQRAQGNEVDALLAKLLMNSLYGKFAQRGLIYEKIDDTSDTTIKVWHEVDGETGEVYHLRQYAGIIEQLSGESESRDSHPAIAAHITAHARAQLWGLIKGAGLNNVFYCDTDSVWVNEVGYSRLKNHCHESRLGWLKLEGVHNDVVINGAKDYIIDGRMRIKGIRAKAVQLDRCTFKQDKFTTLVGLLRRGDLSAPIVSKIVKKLSRVYHKGIVTESGRVIPITLPLE